jgi:hypothetical protein
MAIRDIELPAIQRLTRDLRAGVTTLTPKEARYLVDTYYTMQDYRIEAANQVRALSADGEPATVLAWLFDQMETLEDQVKVALDRWSDSQPMGRWAMSQYGIGPVISAGLLAHIDITRAPTAGAIWRYAGLDPTLRWEKGQKRPWNASLKVICWKIGESFVKFSGRDECTYGKVYVQRKAQEQERNDAGLFADQAAAALAAKRIGKDTEAYKHYCAGKLPPAHIHARAKRVAVKLFLSHYHYRAYEQHYGKPPADPYALAVLGHAHYIEPPD